MLFEFWRRMPAHENIHPEDHEILDKCPGVFRTDVPPGHINGRLKTAPVVACFLNPGFEDEDDRYLNTAEGRAMLIQQREGEQDFPLEFTRWKNWYLPIVRGLRMSDHQVARTAAILNVCAYASKDSSKIKKKLIDELPSAKVARAYLNVLLRQAAEGKRFVVICRGKWAWQISDSSRYENLRFASNPRGGHIGPKIGDEIRSWLSSHDSASGWGAQT